MMKRETSRSILFGLVIFLAVAVAAGRADAAGMLSGESGKDPVVLVHGWSGSVLGQLSVEGYWAFIGGRLTLDGFDVHKIALGDAALQDIRISAGELRAFVADVLSGTGKSKVDLVVHSEGGLVSRYYIQRLGGDAFVDDLVTIASPHRGTTVASIGPGEAARQMEVFSPFVRDLNTEPSLVGNVDHTAIFSNHDELVFPTENGFYAGAVNVNFSLLGHVGIIFNEGVYKVIKGALVNDVADGHRAVPIEIVKDRMTTNQGGVTLKLKKCNHVHYNTTMKQMKVSASPFFTGASWESFSSTKSWQLDIAHDGLKAVYVKFREKEGFLGIGDKESPTYVDYVFYDSRVPEATVDVAPEVTLDTAVEVRLAASDNSDQFKTFQVWNALFAYGIDDLGVKEMILSTSPDFAGAQWQSFAEEATVDLGSGSGLRTVYAKVRDGAGNESPVVSDAVCVADPAAGDVGMVAEGDSDPVVLVHGYGGSFVGDISTYINWIYYTEKLSAEGFDVRRIALGNAALQDIAVSAGELGDFVAGVLSETGAQKVDVVCHSEGGLVARYYVQRLGGSAYVDDLVTIATPHRGTTFASLGPGEAARQMEVAGPFLRELNSGDTTPGDVEYTSVYSHGDEAVVPGKNAFHDGAVNVNYVMFGHAGILFHPEPYEVVRNSLANRYLFPRDEQPVRIVDPDMTTAASQIEVLINASNHYAPQTPVTEMLVADNAVFLGAAWQPLLSKVVLDVSGNGDGLLGIHVKFRGADGVESPSYADYIVLDREAPAGTLEISEVDAENSQLRLKIGASDNTDVYAGFHLAHPLKAYGITELGAREMMVSGSDDFSGAGWEPVAAEKAWPVPPGAGRKTVYLKLRDAAGNESRTLTASAQVFDRVNGYMAVEDHRDPVVFVHGWSGSIAGDLSTYINWVYYVERLEAKGYSTHVIALGNAAMQDITISAAELRDFVAGVIAETGSPKVDIVCHSEGGLVSRYYIQRLGGAAFVDDLVTIASPHRGTIVAEIGPGKAARQMEVASGFLEELNSGDTTSGVVDYTSVFTNNDEAVVPPQNGFYAGAVNINTNFWGHITILFNDEVFDAVKGALDLDVGHEPRELPVYIEKEKMVTGSTDVTLSLNYYNHNSPQYPPGMVMVSADKLFRGASWRRPIPASLPWKLEGEDGLKAVYVKFRTDDASAESPAYVDYIVLDRTPPAGTFFLDRDDADEGTVDLIITASDNSDAYTRMTLHRLLESYGIPGIGLADMMVCNTPDFVGCVWEPFSNSRKWALMEGDTAVYLKLRDAAGNESDVLSAPVDIAETVEEIVEDTLNEVAVNMDFDAGWNLVYVAEGLPGALRDQIADVIGRGGEVFDMLDMDFRPPPQSWVGGGDRAFWVQLDNPFEKKLNLTVEKGAGGGRRIALEKGWNLVGVSGYRVVPLDRLSVTAGPDELSLTDAHRQGWLSEKFFQYAGGKYTAVDTLQPFRAYFVKAQQPCFLNLP